MGIYNVKNSVSDFGLYKYDGQEKRCNCNNSKVYVILLVILVAVCTITSISVHVIQQNSQNILNDEALEPDNTTFYEDFLTDPKNSTIPLTEVSRLISMQTLQENVIQRRKSPPRPFLHGPYDGPIPTSFKSASSPYNRNKQQENWAQLSHYKSPVNNPKNIQDILNYVTNTDNEKSEVESSILIQKPTEPFKSDPFFKYRPQEPSDINLLATASFKFAPPIWKNLRTSTKPMSTSLNQRPILKGPSNYAPIFTLPGNKKPLTVTLNVFPMQGTSNHGPPSGTFGPFPILESESVQRPSFTISPDGLLDKIKNSYNQLFDRREKNILMAPPPKNYLPNKMIIHLNLFPNEDIYKSLGYLQRMDKSVEV